MKSYDSPIPAILILCLVFLSHPVCSQPNADVWVLVFEDDFEREELGPDWAGNDVRIVDGKMLLGIHDSATANITRPFAPDVRIEFDAMAWPEKPPCDLSIGMGSNLDTKRNYNYLLAFGGHSNTANQIIGGSRLERVVDRNPEMLIEEGRLYRLAGTKEGKRLTLEVDGKVLLTTVDEDILGGPGFDYIGVVTWNGMLVDNLRVYERKVPHPDTPRYVSELKGLPVRLLPNFRMQAREDTTDLLDPAVQAYNEGNLKKAEKLFLEFEDPETRAAGLAYVYGHLNWDERADDFARVAKMFAELAAQNPDDGRLADYAWASAELATVSVYHRSTNACRRLVMLGETENPFFNKARLFQARFLRASAQEGGNRADLEVADGIFRELLAKAPDNVVLRELTGEQIPWGEHLIVTDPNVPEWAALLGEMYARQLCIMEWWFTVRQLPNGELGGGWGDDVEILRSWGPFATISDASPEVRNGIERLCQGVWDLALEDGFSPEIGDVEHSAEPSADSLPTMMALRFGDPFWVEANMASTRRIRDYYTGIDQKGFVRFKSGFFGGDKVSNQMRDGGDNFYCARAMKHALWLAWYGNTDAKEFYLNWLEGWLSATMSDDYGKTPGIPPGNIWYPSGDIAPPNGAPWWDPHLNLYGCCSVGNHHIQDMFLSGHYLTQDPRFLEPFHTWMNWHLAVPPPDASENPHISENPLAWAIRNSQGWWWPFTNALMQYRWQTGDVSYDPVLQRHAQAIQRLRINNDLGEFVRNVRRSLDGLRTNFNLQTREVLQTDRAGLTGSDLSFGAFSGGVRRWVDSGVPTMAVTWDVPHSEFAAMVVHGSRQHLRIWVYNLSGKPMPARLHLWQLDPGSYTVRQGHVMPGEGFDRKYRWLSQGRFNLTARGNSFPLTIPPGVEYVVDFRQTERYDRPRFLPDPAIGRRDVKIVDLGGGKADIHVTVHNLGSLKVEDLEVALMRGSEVIETRIFDELPPTRNLMPSTVTAIFAGVTPLDNLRVVLDPESRVRELCETNNVVQIR